MKALSTVAFILTLLGTVCAQSPAGFNYQGVARDLSGAPIPDQQIQLRIAIIQGAASGLEVYKETHSTTTNALGLFNLQIGSGSVVNGVFSSIDWGSNRHFLQIEIDGEGGSNYQLVGTSQLLSVPYALYAESGGFWKRGQIESNNALRDGVFFQKNNSRFDFFNISESIIDRPMYPQFLITQLYTDNAFGNVGEVGLNFVRREEYLDEPTLEFGFPIAQTDKRNFSWRIAGGTKMFLKGNGFLGLGTATPKATIHVADGDVYIEDIGSGVIMKSPNGQCWRMTIDDTGAFNSTSIQCPN